VCALGAHSSVVSLLMKSLAEHEMMNHGCSYKNFISRRASIERSTD
jgi:hypothetical protein